MAAAPNRLSSSSVPSTAHVARRSSDSDDDESIASRDSLNDLIEFDWENPSKTTNAFKTNSAAPPPPRVLDASTEQNGQLAQSAASREVVVLDDDDDDDNDDSHLAASREVIVLDDDDDDESKENEKRGSFGEKRFDYSIPAAMTHTSGYWKKLFRRLIDIRKKHGTLALSGDDADSKYVNQIRQDINRKGSREPKWITPERLAYLANVLGLLPTKSQQSHGDLRASVPLNEYRQVIEKKKRDQKHDERASDIRQTLALASERRGPYENAMSYLRDCVMTLYTGSSTAGAPLRRHRDGNVIKSLVEDSGKTAVLVHTTDVSPDEWEGEKGVLKCFADLSAKSKDYTGRAKCPELSGYKESEMKANPRNHTRHVWATLDAIGAIAWEFDHFMPIILKKIRKGQYTYVKNSDGTYTVYFIIWLYWFFPGNRYFSEFNQTRITNGAIGTNCDLLMKGPDHARADAVSKHPVPILTHPFPSNEAIDSYMSRVGLSRTYCIDHSVYLVHFRLPDLCVAMVS